MFKVGDTVIVLSNINGSGNKQGDIGTITDYDKNAKSFKVTVDGQKDYGNWHAEYELILKDKYN
jgi:ATP-dependent exoDNAse (exonuclease V) alpha subunit